MHWYCEQFGFDAARREARLALAALGDADARAVPILHKNIIEPKRDVLVQAFMAFVMRHSEAQTVLSGGYRSDRLKELFSEYIRTVGVDFASPDYFEARLRVGVVHAWARVGLGTYVTAMRTLQQLLLDEVPPRAHKANVLRSLILKVLALDTGLACEAYHQVQTIGMAHFIDSLQSTGRQLRQALEVDALTGLLSREEILRILRSSIEDARAAAHPCCVVMADIDHFKQVNDQYGHLAGDAVLREIAGRIGDALRQEDRVGRYGGEEFVMVLRHTSQADANEVAERVRAAVAAAPIETGGHVIAVTISQGVAVWTDGESAEAVLARADTAMYRAKQDGRNCVRADSAPTA